MAVRFKMRNAALKTVNVTVNRKSWRCVSSLADTGPRDRVFTVVSRAGGKIVVQFGDGVHGARPPVGGKVTVAYRTGTGAGGSTTTVVLQRKAPRPTPDQDLWVAIRNRAGRIRFEFADRRRLRSRKT